MAGLALLSGYSSDDSDSEPRQDVKSKAQPIPRKRQIVIDSLPASAVQDSVPARKAMPIASSSKHSLFSMLPPPKRQASEVLAERKSEAQRGNTDASAPSAPLQLMEEQTSPEPKSKNNDAFRAMLGLSSSSTKKARTEEKSDPSVQALLPEPASSSVKLDLPPPRSSIHISAAPDVLPSAEAAALETDSGSDPYPGWKLDSDGSWVPVTPEAQAQHQAYLASTAQASNETRRKRANNHLDGSRDLLSAGIDLDDLQSFDASTAARAAYDPSNVEDGDKYAMAASLAAGNRDALAPQPGHLRGLRRGQLSTLINMASENRSTLEQKWQRGREARGRAGNQYGF